MGLLLAGLLAAVGSIVVSTIMDGNSLGVLVGPSSLVIVTLGSLGASVMALRGRDLSRVPKALGALRADPPDPDETVTVLAGLADTARRDGMLALESRLEEVDDPFLRRGLQHVVDGLDADQVHELLEIEIAAINERHQVGIDFFASLGAYAPTFGMLGTVIGLINMLGNLSDPSQLGAGMSLALLTTFYGVLFANLVYLPVAAKLRRLNSVELAAYDITVDGILALQAGASPRLLVERLETYLPPDRRVGFKARAAGTTGSAPTPLDAQAA